MNYTWKIIFGGMFLCAGGCLVTVYFSWKENGWRRFVRAVVWSIFFIPPIPIIVVACIYNLPVSDNTSGGVFVFGAYVIGTVCICLMIVYGFDIILKLNTWVKAAQHPRKPSLDECSMKYNDQLVQLLELLTGGESMSVKYETTVEFRKRKGCMCGSDCHTCLEYLTERHAMEDAQYEIVDTEAKVVDQVALIPTSDKRRGKHVEAIRERDVMAKTQMVELAKDLLTVAMYLKQTTVTIDNCKMAVELNTGKMHQVNMYLNKVDKGDKRMTWKDIMASMAQDRGVVPVVSSIRSTGQAKRWSLPFTKEKSISTSYLVNHEWNIMDKAFNSDFMQLLPAARLLVDEQLSRLYTETIGDTEYLQVMFDDTESQLSSG